MTKAIVLTPTEVRERLQIITPDFQTVLDEADRKGLNVIYYYNATPVGTFPMVVEIDYRQEI